MPPPRDDDVFEHLHALMHLFKHQLHRASGPADAGLAPMEARALGFFARNPGSTATELAQHAQRDKAQITRVLQGLLERGLLEREPDAADRRSHHLRLSDAGRTLQRAQQQQRRRLADKMVSGLSIADRATLMALLERLRANLEAGAS